MARVLLATQAWGVVQGREGDSLSGVPVQLADVNGDPADVFTTEDGSAEQTLVTNTRGEIPGWAEDGSYNLTIAGVTRRVELVSAAVRNITVTGGNFVSVTEFGALGNNTGNDAPAIQAAIDAVYAAGGGTVLLPSGQYRCTSAITLKAKVGFLGEGQAATKINFPTDLGAGAVGITMEGTQLDAAWIQNLHIQGSGSFEIGVQNCDMDGVQPYQSSKLTDVSVYGFRAAVKIIADHQIFTRCKFGNSYWGVLYDEDFVSAGNQQFYSCFIEGNNFACIGVLGSAIIDYVLFAGGNCAQAPYGFYKADGPTTGPSGRGLMSNTILDGFAFEGIGNAAILDESTGGGSGQDTMTSCKITDVGFSWGGPTRAIGARSTDYAVNVRNVTDTEIVMGSGQFYAFDDTVGHPFRVLGQSSLKIVMPATRRSGDDSTMFSADSAIGIEVERRGVWTGRTATARDTMVAGDLLEVATAGGDEVRLFSGSGTPFAGFAAEAAVADGTTIVVKDGFYPSANLEGSAVQGNPLKPDPTTKHHLARAPSQGFAPTTGIATDYPIVAYATSGSGGSTVPVEIRVEPDRFYVKPSNVTALPTASSTYRGQMVRVEGGVGVADGLYICQKKADNTYAWQQVTVT